MNRLAVWLGSFLVVGSVLAIGGTLGWIKYKEIATAMAAPPPEEQPISVTPGLSTNVSYRRSTTVIGTVQAPRSITLSNEIAGTVVFLGFESGAKVDQGQKLVELDTSVERAQLKSASARLKIAESTLSRTRDAAKNRAVSELELEETESVFAQASAEIMQLEAIIARKTLVAPFPARIGLCNTHEGQFLPSGTAIVTLQSLDGYVNIDFMVPQSAADFVQVGSPITLIDDGATLIAKISAIDSQADRATRNVMVRAELEPAPEHLLPGESIKVFVEYGPELENAAVPAEAVRRAPMRTFVYVIEEDAAGKLKAWERDVKVGQMIGERFSVLSGLDDNVRVVADGSFKLSNGASIVLKDIKASVAEPPVNRETAGK